MSSIAYGWAPITKVEDQPDGTVIVHGPMASNDLDRDMQRFSQEFLDKAIPQWFNESGNIREQHDPKKACGNALMVKRDEATGRWDLAAHIVDPIAVKKVQSKTYKGFSIGVKHPKIDLTKAQSPAGEIYDGLICETSVCDRPSNPTTVFQIVKSDGDGDELVFEPGDGLIEKAIQGTDVAAKADAILDQLDELLPDVDLTKYDEASDIAGAQDAITCIARLIQSEAAELAAGRQEELRDIRILVDAVSSLQYFLEREQQQAQMPDERTDDSGGQAADDFDMAGAVTMKTDNTNPADDGEADATKVDKTDLEKVDIPAVVKAEIESGLAKMDLPAIVKAAVAEVTTASEERLKSLEAQVTKALALPEPGGPVQIRTAPQQAQAQAHETQAVRAQIADLLHKADAIGNSDSTLAAGYRANAEKLERTLTG